MEQESARLIHPEISFKFAYEAIYCNLDSWSPSILAVVLVRVDGFLITGAPFPADESVALEVIAAYLHGMG